MGVIYRHIRALWQRMVADRAARNNRLIAEMLCTAGDEPHVRPQRRNGHPHRVVPKGRT